jgi:hypothetical protein
MKYLILVRHGSYDKYDGRISSFGKECISNLTRNKLKGVVDSNEKTIIISSTAPRALDSAEIISDVLNIEFEENTILWSDAEHRKNFDNVLEMVRSYKEETDVLILVTHLEYVESFPCFFGRFELGVELDSDEIGKGEAWAIDCKNKTLTLLPFN